jgi:hypothetical protein
VRRNANRSWLVLAVSTALSLAVVAVPTPARADGKSEGAAKQLEAKAMQEDFLTMDFDKALTKLNQAIGLCGADKCSNLVRAQIERDIGVVQIAKQNRPSAVNAFTDALKADPNVQLDPDTKNKDVSSAWAEAQSRAGAAPVAPAPTSAAPATGDFTITPPPETQVRTPLDIYVESVSKEAPAKVALKYKAFGMTEWKSVDAKPMGKGWGAEIPCADIIQGDVQYYVQGFDSSGEAVAMSGSRSTPYKTSAKRNFDGDIPHFPGASAPKQCADTGDCPPDFPGCKKAAPESSSLRDDGADCQEGAECKSGTCGADKVCIAEEPHKAKEPRFWVGVEFMYDLVNIPGAQDACLLSPSAEPLGSSNNYYCTENGQDFPSRNDNGAQNSTIKPGGSDQVAGGFVPGNARILVSFDYALSHNFLLGGRVGYVFNTYNGQAAYSEGKGFPIPLHVEVRGTYVFGHKALVKAGLAPYVLGALGVGEYSGNVSVSVITTAPTTPEANAWNLGGPGFFALGTGLRYAFTPNIAAYVGPRLSVAFGLGSTLVAISPDIGIAYGF